MKMKLELHTYKKTWNEWTVCNNTYTVETAFFTIDACNLILSIFALSEQTYHLKLKLCVLNVCSNFFPSFSHEIKAKIETLLRFHGIKVQRY